MDKKEDKKEKMVNLSLRVPSYQKTYLQQMAVLMKTNVPELMRELIDLFIETTN